MAQGRRTLVPSGKGTPGILGVINATPDSFWEGSRYPDPAGAAAAARAMVRAGASALDLGAVSSYPRAAPVPPEVERERLLPVLAAVRAAVDCPVCVDTTRSEIAAAALEVGADAINDVSGLEEPELAATVARAGATLIGVLPSRLGRPPEVSVALGVAGELLAARAGAAGLPRARLVLDPGFGFGKTVAQNLELVAALPALRERWGLPVCVGPSRKGTISRLLGGRPPEERLGGTAALVALCAAYGADLIRVHDVADMAEVAAVAAAVGRPRPTSILATPGSIRLQGIRVEACHGVLAEEHTRPQPFLVDLDLELDLSVAARSDELAATVDYARAAAAVVAVLEGPHRDLIESLAGEIARRVLQAHPTVRGGVVEVHKPQAPVGVALADVSVRLPFARAGGG